MCNLELLNSRDVVDQLCVVCMLLLLLALFVMINADVNLIVVAIVFVSKTDMDWLTNYEC